MPRRCVNIIVILSLYRIQFVTGLKSNFIITRKKVKIVVNNVYERVFPKYYPLLFLNLNY